MFQDYILLHFLFNVLRLLFFLFSSMFQDFSTLSHTKTVFISIHSFHFYSFIYEEDKKELNGLYEMGLPDPDPWVGKGRSQLV